MPKFSANLSMLFTEVPFLDRFAAAAKAGFRGVEYVSPYDYEPGEIIERLDGNGLQQVLFNLPAGNWAGGERGIAVLPDRVAEFRAGVAQAITYAKALRCPQVNCLAGIAPAAASPALLRETFIDNLRYAGGELERAGIRLLIEPINTRDIPGFYLSRSAQALDLIAGTGSANIYLQYDVYHMQVMEGDLAETIASRFANIKHVQIAGNPGRHEPGTGEINYPFIISHLDRLGYDGWIGAEYKPATTTAAGLGWLSKLGG